MGNATFSGLLLLARKQQRGRRLDHTVRPPGAGNGGRRVISTARWKSEREGRLGKDLIWEIAMGRVRT
jgi:hypothetical protein